MTVLSAIIAAIPAGVTLETLSRRRAFMVAEYRAEAAVLLLGPQRSRTPIPWQVWEELGAWLTARGWTELGAGRGNPTSSESLNSFLDARIPRSAGTYVAAMLVKAGLAGQLTRCFMFAFRLSCSGKGIHRVYASQAQEAFLEGHVTAFEVTGGIPPGPAVCEPAVSNPAASF